MSTLLLIVMVVLVLYGLWLLFAFTFTMIDIAHELRRESERRNTGVTRVGEREQ